VPDAEVNPRVLARIVELSEELVQLTLAIHYKKTSLTSGTIHSIAQNVARIKALAATDRRLIARVYYIMIHNSAGILADVMKSDHSKLRRLFKIEEELSKKFTNKEEEVLLRKIKLTLERDLLNMELDQNLAENFARVFGQNSTEKASLAVNIINIIKYVCFLPGGVNAFFAGYTIATSLLGIEDEAGIASVSVIVAAPILLSFFLAQPVIPSRKKIWQFIGNVGFSSIEGFGSAIPAHVHAQTLGKFLFKNISAAALNTGSLVAAICNWICNFLFGMDAKDKAVELFITFHQNYKLASPKEKPILLGSMLTLCFSAIVTNFSFIYTTGVTLSKGANWISDHVLSYFSVPELVYTIMSKVSTGLGYGGSGFLNIAQVSFFIGQFHNYKQFSFYTDRFSDKTQRVQQFFSELVNAITGLLNAGAIYGLNSAALSEALEGTWEIAATLLWWFVILIGLGVGFFNGYFMGQGVVRKLTGYGKFQPMKLPEFSSYQSINSTEFPPFNQV